MKLNALLVDIRGCSARSAGTSSSGSAGCCPDLGVIVCTQGSTVAQRVRGLRLGADDWISSPRTPRR